MIINLSDNGGGIIVQSTAEEGVPVGDDTMLWVDVDNYGITKYWNGEAWVPTAAVWT